MAWKPRWRPNSRSSQPVGEWIKAEPQLGDDEILKRLLDAGDAAYRRKDQLSIPPPGPASSAMSCCRASTPLARAPVGARSLRQGIHLRGYAQKNPKQEYKREAFELFEGLLQTVRSEVSKLLMTVEVRSEEQIEEAEAPPQLENVQYHHADYDEALGHRRAQGAATGRAAYAQGRPQRSLSLRQREEVQALPRQAELTRERHPTIVEDGDAVLILDQTRLPREAVMLRLSSLEDAAHAIRVMQVRGAPLIGATAAYGVALGLADDGSDCIWTT
jgi:hypothetical protein